MNTYRISFIGHRQISDYNQIESKINEIIEGLFKEYCYIDCYIGRHGEFDIYVASVIKRIQRERKNDLFLNLVLPYEHKDQKYFLDYYDEVLYPLARDVHFKSAIIKRNEWMVDNSELLVAYVNQYYGGAYATLQYAKKKNKTIINLA